MPDIIYLISRWRKQIMLVVLVSLAIAASLVFIMPSQYLASSTALPTNPVTADKSIVFNNNIRDLYNSLGQSGDLDKIVGTGQLDTIYIAVATQYNLVSHYKINEDKPSAAIRKAARTLKKDTRITKSEYGELLVQVWNKDKTLAPQLANSLMEKLAAIHGDLLNKNNLSILHSLKNGRKTIERSLDSLVTSGPQTGSASQSPGYNRATLLQEQIKEYEKLETEYQLMTDAKPAAIVIVERARISENPDRPKRLIILLATAVASFLFALWLALILEKRKTSLQ